MTTDAAGRFAELLRQHRRAAGLTQAELAATAGLAVRTVRDLERGHTARPQRSTVTLLADALGLEGVRRTEFVSATRTGGRLLSDAPAAILDTGHGPALPPPPVLIGRDAEIAALVKAVAERAGAPRPITLVGLAGVGKSVLALRVAHEVAHRFPGGVAGVTIDEHGDIEEALASVSFVFAVGDAAELATAVTPRPALLLLDAAERAPHKVRELLRLLPESLHVIITSRVPIGVVGEQPWPIGALALPPPDVDVELSEVAAYPAAALLLDRLGRVRNEPLAADEVAALVGLVRRLGGLPLALELAAAHGRLLRLPEILQRYGDRVLDLGGGEDQTLREAVASSYRLLNAAERHALRVLAVFRHRWSIELAEQVFGGSVDPVPLLDRLVSLGLVAVSGAREHRFRLLGVVRDFASEQADRHGELAAMRRAHARAITQLAERVAQDLAGPSLRAGVAVLDDLAPDLWAALSYAANDDPHTALRLAAQLPRWWRLRGRDRAGRQWLRRLRDDPRTQDVDPSVRAWAQVGLAQLANEHGEGAVEREATAGALETFQQLGDVVGQLAAGNVLSSLWLAEGRHEEARRYTEMVLNAAYRAGRLREATVAQTNLTWHEIRVGDLEAARRRLAAVDRLAAQVSDDRLRVLAAANLAEVARLQERYEEAVARGRRVLTLLDGVGDPGHRRRVAGTVGQALAMLELVGEAREVLGGLRGRDSGTGAEAMCAMIEARLAMTRGDRFAAAEWFEAGAAAFRRGQDRRDLLEALVGAAAFTSDPRRREWLSEELRRVADDGGFTLLPSERALLGWS